MREEIAWTIVTIPRNIMIDTEPPNGLIIIKIPQTREINDINLAKNSVGPVNAEEIVAEVRELMMNQIPRTIEKMPALSSLKAKSKPTATKIAQSTVGPTDLLERNPTAKIAAPPRKNKIAITQRRTLRKLFGNTTNKIPRTSKSKTEIKAAFKPFLMPPVSESTVYFARLLVFVATFLALVFFELAFEVAFVIIIIPL